MDSKKAHAVYTLLTHAALHCRFGSDTVDRIPDKADLEAATILYRLRAELAVEHYESIYE